MPEIGRPEATKYRLRLFGQIELSVDLGAGRVLAVPVSGLPARLLAFLALHPARRHARADLLATLWPEGKGKSPGGMLSTALWRLRHLVDAAQPGLPPLVQGTADGLLGLAAGGHVWVDHTEFGQLLGGNDDAAQLREGVALYADSLLAGLNDDWVLRERELARQQWLKALVRLMQIGRIAGEHERALACARTVLDADPLREDIHRQVMCLYAESGQRPLALRQFEHCRDVLARELGVSPLPETVHLYREIAKNQPGAALFTPGEERLFAGHVRDDREATVSLLIEARSALARVETALAAALRFQGGGPPA
jgi:DNA-binding SARP family transcriptional activator